AFSIISNPTKVEIRENFYDNLLSLNIGKENEFPISSEDKQEKSKEIFSLLARDEVITASRKAQKITEAPSKIFVINSDTIKDRGYRTLTEALQDVPFFDFNSFYDSGEYPTDFLLRGISDVGQTQVLIMEDGIIQNDIGNGWSRHVQFDYTLIDVERIEIILGPGSALYGSNAYAGLINIITKKASNEFTEKKSGFKTDTRISYGYADTKMGETFSSYKFENGLTFQIAGRYYSTPGDRGKNRHDPGNYFNNNYEPDYVTTTEYGKIANDKYPGNISKPLVNGYNNSAKNAFIRGKATYENFTFGFNYWELREGLSNYVPSYEYFSNTPDKPFYKDHRGHYSYISYNFNFNNKISSVTKLYTRETAILPDTGFVYTYRYQGVDFPSSNGVPLSPVIDKAKQYNGKSNLSGIQQQLNFKLTNSNELLTGFQLDRSTIQSISDSGGGVSLGRRQSTDSNIVLSRWNDETTTNAQVYYTTLAAFYLQDEQKLFGDKYSLTVGVRRDQDSNFGKVWTTRAGFVGNPFDKINFKLLYGTAFKAPTLFQLYDEFRGNRFLKPQRIQTSEAEVSFTPLKKLKINTGYFFSMLTNLIAEAPNPNDGRFIVGSAGQYASYFQNFKPTHIYGYSLQVDYSLLNELSLYANYTFTGDRDSKTPFIIQADTNGMITSIEENKDGHEIDNIAAKKFNIGVNYLLKNKLNINLRMNWVGKRKAPSSNYYYQPYDYGFTTYPYVTEGKPDGYLSGYTLLNLVLTWKRLFDIAGLEPQLLVLNIFDRKYVGMGRQSGNAVRPIDSHQPYIQNPSGFVSPYHPQPGRQIFLQISYRY
ncbi:MAG: TonB-dependent receptor plug domain-containing protein, partial [Leptospiraceae bacterium]|nr:TonB-dependent receptor plug domain-containing protein [Leptospiraceae bacterium]